MTCARWKSLGQDTPTGLRHVLFSFSYALMRFGRDHLVFKALCALDEVADSCRLAPVQPTFATRFALAFLYSVSDGNRSSFDGFWRAVQDPFLSAYSDDDRVYLRVTHANGALVGIMRSVGAETTPRMMSAVSDARRKHRVCPPTPGDLPD